ncbi:MAG: D-Ala-D-Ala carboxypeptidase family metallohydrolase [Simkaniaceae bacterium]|nr:D-Ala-D-Ala carboxypeptidase family metallohydrolase [Simkaniaceae bacterium]
MKSLKNSALLKTLFSLLLVGCSRMEESEREKVRELNMHSEPIYRHADERLFPTFTLNHTPRDPYPWEQDRHLPRITKDYFRCRGDYRRKEIIKRNHLGNPYALIECRAHSLPIRSEREFIYPALISALNSLQKRLQKKVVITSGHRCPFHNRYIGAPGNSKHLVGAEVDFYVEGYEKRPGVVIQALTEEGGFLRNGNTWSNRDLAIHLVPSGEGRSLDNDHPYPYISLEVLREEGKRVLYNWHRAHSGYHRY